ncbi:uncharacterized protein [Solanum lycopersicum]|uniref:uncharacterized protein n=1 Tax=Solanum lycopersicum TaxID=4081 RepID=UPI00374A0CF9
MLKKLSINVHLIAGLEQMPGYSKFMKDMVTKKRSDSFEDNYRMQHCSAIATRSLVQNKVDLDVFTITCTMRLLHFAKALCDLGASINLMPLSIYTKLGLDDPKPMAMRLLMDDRMVKRSTWILHNVFVKIEQSIYAADFVILDYEVDFEVPIIHGRSFHATFQALVYVEKGKIVFLLHNKEVAFNICRSTRQSGEVQSVSAISYRVKSFSKVQIEEFVGVEALATVIFNFESDCIEEYGSLVAALH